MVEQELARLRLEEERLVKSIRHHIQREEPECKVAHLPVPMAKAKVEYVFIAMEPSFGHWAKNEREAKEKVQKGFRSFVNSWEDFTFLYSVELFLPSSHYVTDVSKAAMPVKDARKHRSYVWKKSVALLKKEIDIVGKPNCRVLCVGQDVQAFLKDKLDRDIFDKPLLHYSSRTNQERSRIARENIEDYVDFRIKFRWQLSSEAIRVFAEEYMIEHDVPPEMRREILEGLDNSRAKLNSSRKQLMYAYYRGLHQIKERKRPT